MANAGDAFFAEVADSVNSFFFNFIFVLSYPLYGGGRGRTLSPCSALTVASFSIYVRRPPFGLVTVCSFPFAVAYCDYVPIAVSACGCGKIYANPCHASTYSDADIFSSFFILLYQ